MAAVRLTFGSPPGPCTAAYHASALSAALLECAAVRSLGPASLPWSSPLGVRERALGKELYAVRDVKRHEVVLVEVPLLEVRQPEGAPPYTTDASPDALLEHWNAQLRALALADDACRAAALALFAPADSLLPPVFVETLNAAIAKLAELNDIPASEDARHFVLAFATNAVQHGDRLILPAITSRANHSCVPNATRVVDFPEKGQVTLCAAEPIGEGDAVTLDYTGHRIWGRMKRQAWLKHAKWFTCSCRRCTQRPDFEGALVCPRCLPPSERRGGFQLPHPLPPGVGCVVREPAPNGAPPSWVCGACGLCVSDAELDTPLAPARQRRACLRSRTTR